MDINNSRIIRINIYNTYYQLLLMKKGAQIIEASEQQIKRGPEYILNQNAQLIKKNAQLTRLKQRRREEQIECQQSGIDNKYYKTHNSIFTKHNDNKEQQNKSQNSNSQKQRLKWQQHKKQMILQHNQEINKIKNECSQKITILQNENKKIMTQLAQLKSFGQTLQQQLSGSQKHINTLLSSNEALKSSLEKEKLRYKQRQEIKSNLQQSNKNLQDQLRLKNAQISSKHGEIERMKKQLNSNTKNVLEQNTTKISQLQADKASLQSEINSFIKEMQNLSALNIQQVLKLTTIDNKQRQQLKKVKNVRIVKLADVRQFMQKYRSNISLVVNSVNRTIVKIKEDLSQSQSQNKGKNQSISTLNLKLIQSQKNLQAKKEQNQKKATIINSQNDRISSLSAQKQKEKQLFQAQRSKFLVKISTLEQTIKKEKAQKGILDEKIEKQNQQIKTKDQQIKKLNLNKDDLQRLNKSKTQDNQKLGLQKKLLEDKQKSSQEQIKDKKGTIKSLQSLLVKANKDLEISQGQIQKLTTFIDQLNKKVFKLNEKIEQQTIQLGKNSKTIDHLKQKQHNLNLIQKDFVNEITHNLSGQAQFIDQQDINRSIDNVKQKLINAFNQEKFFNNSDFIPKHKVSWIIEKVQEFMYLKVKTTKIIYKFDEQNKTNFHSYFDKKENLFVIVKLCNGTLIGGFTVYPFDPDKVQKPGKGFLLNLNRSKCYNMRQNPRLAVTTYDKFYFILGNAEIRIKSLQKKVFSNFGIALSTFDNGSDNKRQFLNDQNQNELQIEGYEFYQIFFNG